MKSSLNILMMFFIFYIVVLLSMAQTSVFTIRNTHGKILHSTLNKVHKYREHDGQATLEVSLINEYHIDFTLDELRYEMPQKLTTAWGINGSIPRLVIQEQFPTYERVLTHPVFVGIFSKLICDGELFQTGEEQTMEAHLTVGEYSFHHAEFYRSVISNGVEWG